MEIKTKHRIIGVVVLVALAIIIIPMFLGRSQTPHKSSLASNPIQKQAAQLTAVPSSNNTQASNDNETALQPANESSLNESDNTNSTANDLASQTQTSVAVATTSQDAAAADVVPNNTAPLKPISTSPQDQGSLETPTIPQHHKEVVPRTKTGVTKKHYAATASKNKKHEKIAVKHIEKVKHASLAHAWTVQLASFTQKANAEVLVKQLRAKGFAAYIHEAKSAKGDGVSRVFVGPELKKERADNMVKKLHEEFHLKGVVVEYKV